MKAFIYYNLHKHCWSLRALEGPSKGKVYAHAHSVVVLNAVFKVSEKGRQRVIREQKKNVHAGVVGNVIAIDSIEIICTDKKTAVTYNPYKYPTFVTRHNEQPITHARQVYMQGRNVEAYD